MSIDQEVSMDFRFTEDEKDFRMEVRNWIKKVVPERWYELDHGEWEETDESWAISREFHKKLGQKRWLAPAYPKKYGGGEISHMKRLIIAEELARNRAPVGVETEIAVNWVGPSILLFGTEEHKLKHAKGVATGDLVFCLGYSEPSAGSDLASIMTTAIEDGDDYVINGSKIWTSYGHYADYCWLVARTDPNAKKKYHGVSMFIVDMKSPGITVRPIINILNHHSFNEVFFNDVRVPKKDLIGEKNNGFYQLMISLDYERSSIGVAAGLKHMLEELVELAKERGKNNDPIIRQKIAEIASSIEVSRMMCYRIAWMYSKNLHPSYESSMSMVFMSEIIRKMVQVAMDIAGPFGQLEMDSKYSILKGRIARDYLRSLSIGIGGGTNEIQRNIIAMRGLELPRK